MGTVRSLVCLVSVDAIIVHTFKVCEHNSSDLVDLKLFKCLVNNLKMCMW